MSIEPQIDRPKRHAGYEQHKADAAKRVREMSLAGRDIGAIPKVKRPTRRRACSRNFRKFCETYFAHVFALEWSSDHLKVIAKIERAVLNGELFAMAMPRGSGKTTLCEVAGTWAILYGHSEFIAIVAADERLAVQILDSIKAAIEHNETLGEDFPEVCYPVASLEGIHQRAAGQLCEGRQTHIGWKEREIILPTIPKSKASGSIIRVAGITGQIRGMKHTRTDGVSIRPSLVLIDDPQTDESASSLTQSSTRERIIKGAILGLAGPGKKIAGLMTVTVIRPDDLSDRILDRERNPHWQAERTKMVYAFPTNENLWEDYAKILIPDLIEDRGKTRATEFYRANQAAMDAGAVVAWKARFDPDEVSAIQSAMNLRIRDAAAFAAEYQNEPLPLVADDADLLTADQIVKKLNGVARGVVPGECSVLTAFVDVQDKVLYWMVVGWSQEYTGYIVDYGTEPDQKDRHFALRTAKRTLAAAAHGTGREGAIRAGLERLAAMLLGREWQGDDGSVHRIDRLAVDANWGEQTDTVKQFCRQSPFAASIIPAHGRFVGASSNPINDRKRKPGEKVGLHWRVTWTEQAKHARHLLFDTNFWKSFVHARLAVAMGDSGCLSLYGHNAGEHRLLAEHLTAEYRVKTEGRGRTVYEWKLRLDNIDNHWLDCLVGCAVLASERGIARAEMKVGRGSVKKIRYSDRQRLANQNRES